MRQSSLRAKNSKFPISTTKIIFIQWKKLKTVLLITSEEDIDESGEYIIFDKNGNFTNIYCHQDNIKAATNELLKLLETGLPERSLENVLEELFERAEGNLSRWDQDQSIRYNKKPFLVNRSGFFHFMQLLTHLKLKSYINIIIPFESYNLITLNVILQTKHFSKQTNYERK